MVASVPPPAKRKKGDPKPSPLLLGAGWSALPPDLVRRVADSLLAMFIGHQRSLAIDADKFPGIDANCVYYTDILGSSAHICKWNIKDRKVERISESAEFLKQDKKFALVADRPWTIIHLFCSYTINIPVLSWLCIRFHKATVDLHSTLGILMTAK
ncbi:uncharacterized protein [Triticum aestivum]|uniref:uncharacterized protein n=1 Tax=Triticum aestivum TaxID=4565 RepID=UPI0005819952|nr:uncharacterized protein LOC123067857 [Triticum aestivum]